jgi:hypothetical protein
LVIPRENDRRIRPRQRRGCDSDDCERLFHVFVFVIFGFGFFGLLWGIQLNLFVQS